MGFSRASCQAMRALQKCITSASAYTGCGLFEGGTGACQHVAKAARWRGHQPFGLDGIHQGFAGVGVAAGRDGQVDEGVSQGRAG
jgi:hypothetical protein